jgi:hypothetical protein
MSISYDTSVFYSVRFVQKYAVDVLLVALVLFCILHSFTKLLSWPQNNFCVTGFAYKPGVLNISHTWGHIHPLIGSLAVKLYMGATLFKHRGVLT